MPFVTEQNQSLGTLLTSQGLQLPEFAPPETPDFLSTVAAAFRLDNPVVSFAASTTAGRSFPLDNGYDPFKLAKPGLPYDYASNPYVNLPGKWGLPEYAKHFVGSRGAEHTAAIVEQISREESDRAIIANSGGLGLASSLVAGTVDPLLLMAPGFAVVKTAKGISRLASVGVSAAMTAGAVGAQEAALQATQYQRPGEQSLAAVGGAALLGGIFGGAMSHMTESAFARAAKAMEEAQTPLNMPGKAFIKVSGASPEVGGVESAVKDLAAATPDNAPKLASALGLEHVLKWGFPRLQGFMSDAPIMRTLTNRLINAPMLVVGGEKVVPAEARVRLWYNNYVHAMDRLQDHYVRFATLGQRQSATTMEKIIGFKKMTLHDPGSFYELVGKAMRRLDNPGELELFDAPIVEAAKDMRENVILPLAKQAVDQGMMPKEVLDTPGYLNRVYDRPLLEGSKEARADFVNRVSEYFLSQASEKGKELSASSAQRQAAKALDNILDVPLGRSIPGDVHLRGPFIERQLDVPDSIIEPFLVSDVRRVLGFYVRSVGGDVEIARASSLLGARKALEDTAADVVAKIRAEGEKQPGRFLRNRDAMIFGPYKSDLLNKTIENGRARFGITASSDLVRSIRNAISDEDAAALLDKTLAGQIRDLILTDAVKKIRAQADDAKALGILKAAMEQPSFDDLIAQIKGAEGDNAAKELLVNRDNALVKMFSGGDMSLAIDQVQTHWDGRIKAEREKTDLYRKMANRDLENLSLYRDNLRGMLDVVDPKNFTGRVMKSVRQWAYMTIGGMIPISQLNDFALPVFNYGFGTVNRALSEAFFKDGAQVVRGLAKKDMEKFLAASEVITNLRGTRMLDIADEVGHGPPARTWYGKVGTGAEKALDKMSHLFSVFTGMAPINQITRDMVAIYTSQFILENAVKVAEGKALEKAVSVRLGELGLDDAWLGKIGKQWTEHGESDGVRSTVVANLQAWTDKGAVDQFRGAHIKAQDFNMPMGSALDRPRIPGLTGELGRFVFMFRNYGLSVTQRVLGRAIQYRDGQSLIGAMTIMGLTGLTVLLRDGLRGKTDRSFKSFAFESVRQSALAGAIFDVDRITSQMTNNTIGVTPFFDDKPRPYSSADMAVSLLGAPAAVVRDTFGAGFDVAGGHVTPQTVGKIRRSLILNNVWYWRRLFDSMEEKGRASVSEE